MDAATPRRRKGSARAGFDRPGHRSREVLELVEGTGSHVPEPTER